MPGIPGETACRTTNFRVYGNVFGSFTAGEGNCGGPSGVVFSHNVYAGDRYKSTCGGTGEVWVGTATMPWYADNDPGPAR